MIQIVFTGRNEVVAKVIFLQRSVILFTGGVCLSACWDTAPPSRHPSQSRHPPGPDTTPPEQTHTPPDQTFPGSRHPPEQTPPPGSIWSTSGRYASYILVYSCNYFLVVQKPYKMCTEPISYPASLVVVAKIIDVNRSTCYQTTNFEPSRNDNRLRNRRYE